MRKALTILGSTGTIGDSTLKVLSLHPDKFCLFALLRIPIMKKCFNSVLFGSPNTP